MKHQEKGRGEAKNSPVIVSLSNLIVAVKLILHPIIAYFILSILFVLPVELAKPGGMVAATPCGVMSFMLALKYGVKVDHKARVILLSSLLSLLTISFVAII